MGAMFETDNQKGIRQCRELVWKRMNGEITQKQLEQATAEIINDDIDIDNFIADIYLNEDFRQIKLPMEAQLR